MASADPERPSVERPDTFSAKQAERPAVEIAPGRTALLLIDLVNDYLEPQGAMPMPGTGPLLDVNRELAEVARRAGVLVVWLRPGHLEAEDGLFRKRIVHAVGESWGAQLHSALGVADAERVVRKRRYSGFFQTDLDLYLREHDIRRVVCTGVALNICVRSTVHDAFYLGYDVWVVRDACQATAPREEESSLYDIQTHFGEVKDAAGVMEAWA
jgi:ureidoacrylate peracid hydrolase